MNPAAPVTKYFGMDGWQVRGLRSEVRGQQYRDELVHDAFDFRPGTVSRYLRFRLPRQAVAGLPRELGDRDRVMRRGVLWPAGEAG